MKKNFSFILLFIILSSIFQPSAFSKNYPGGFTIHITATPNNQNPRELQLTANILTDKFNNTPFKFQWHLPSGVTASDNTTANLVFDTNNAAQTTLLIQIPDENKNYRIIGEAHRWSNGEALHGAVKAYNTNPKARAKKQMNPSMKKGRILR